METSTLCPACSAAPYQSNLRFYLREGAMEVKMPMQVEQASSYLPRLKKKMCMPLPWTIAGYNDFIQQQSACPWLGIQNPWHVCAPERFLVPVQK